MGNQNIRQDLFDLGFPLIDKRKNNNRYFGQHKEEELINNAIELYKTLNDNEKKDMKSSILTLIKEFNYYPPGEYRISKLPIPIKDKPSFYGYKLVCIKDKITGKINLETAALIELVTDIVADSATGTVIPVDKIKNGEKYCTGCVIPTRVWVFGQPKETIKMIDEVKKGTASLVSNFDPHFEYKVSHKTTEPNFTKEGKGCVQGIHFFIDKKSAIKYLSTGFIPIDIFGLISSKDINGCDIEYPEKSGSAITEEEIKAQILSLIDIEKTPLWLPDITIRDWHKRYNDLVANKKKISKVIYRQNSLPLV